MSSCRSRRKLAWKKVHQATSEIAARLAASAPETFTTTMGKENRKRRIFIDFHRNARGAHGGRALLAARAHQPAGLDAARLERS